MDNNYCVLMAGGIGTRFWPISKTAHPKQFIDILGTGQTLIQQTYYRFARKFPKENIYIVTNNIYRDLVMEQIPDVTPDNILCEPTRRNTAPCIAFATYKIYQKDPDARIVVAPSDHIILKEDIFLNDVDIALNLTEKCDCLLTLGITPSRPDTGYGYIQFNEDVLPDKDARIKKVKTFTEKPDLDLAKSFIESGDFLWNSGIFIWSAKSILKAFEMYLPEINGIFNEGLDKFNTSEEDDFIRQAYSVCKNISIDYGIMEKARNVFVLCSDFGWSDLGTWGSLFDNHDKDYSNNAIIGNNIMTYDTTDCIISVPKDKLVVIEGLTDYIVAESKNILLICKKTDEQKIREFVNDVKIIKGEQFV
ncbi:MAG: mannose-1-phosphate guanylyltransferase [Bacteroidota bacterium]|nr:mannose-1-phosphate guanylyltransferase [Bacteroidota bacterium]